MLLFIILIHSKKKYTKLSETSRIVLLALFHEVGIRIMRGYELYEVLYFSLWNINEFVQRLGDNVNWCITLTTYSIA